MSGVDLSWFCCICCARRPLPEASFTYLLTSCSHIVCSSCWERRGGSECPKCGQKANTLNLSGGTLPKMLEPYFTDPAVLMKKMLKVYEFQEHQKRQMRKRREAAWALIGRQRAQEDYEREYAECKELQMKENTLKKEVKMLEDLLRSHGIDPSHSNVTVTSRSPSTAYPTPAHPTHPTPGPTPFIHTPLAAPPSTSTPAIPGGHPPAVEFVEPKKLPHTMRGSVTSKAVRWSPSNRATPISTPTYVSTNGTNILPVKRLHAVTPVRAAGHQQQRLVQSGSGSVRIRPPSSTLQRMPPPPPPPSLRIHPSPRQHSVAMRSPSGLYSTGAPAVAYPRPRSAGSLHQSQSGSLNRSHSSSSMLQPSPRSRPVTPTNPSPLLRAYTTTPQMSPRQQGPTPPPGARLSGVRSLGRGPRLTPVRSE